MVFALNQVDIVEPMNWDNRINLPSEEMEVNIQIIEKDRAEKLSNILQSNLDIISYSAKHGFNLEQLFYMVVEKAPQNRRWIFDGLKNFSYSDFIPEGVRGYLMD